MQSVYYPHHFSAPLFLDSTLQFPLSLDTDTNACTYIQWPFLSLHLPVHFSGSTPSMKWTLSGLMKTCKGCVSPERRSRTSVSDEGRLLSCGTATTAVHPGLSLWDSASQLCSIFSTSVRSIFLSVSHLFFKHVFTHFCSIWAHFSNGNRIEVFRTGLPPPPPLSHSVCSLWI